MGSGRNMVKSGGSDPSMEDILESIRRIVVARETDDVGSSSEVSKLTASSKANQKTAAPNIDEIIVEELSSSSDGSRSVEREWPSDRTVGLNKNRYEEVNPERNQFKPINTGYNPPVINKILIGGKSNLTMSLKAEQQRVQELSPVNDEALVSAPESVAGSQSTAPEHDTPVEEELDILDLTQLVDLDSVDSTKGVWVRGDASRATGTDALTKKEAAKATEVSNGLSEQRAYQKHLEDQIKQALSLENYSSDKDTIVEEALEDEVVASDDLSESLDDYIRSLVQKRVQHWLDTSLEDMVERIVREEIKAALQRAKK